MRVSNVQPYMSNVISTCNYRGGSCATLHENRESQARKQKNAFHQKAFFTAGLAARACTCHIKRDCSQLSKSLGEAHFETVVGICIAGKRSEFRSAFFVSGCPYEGSQLVARYVAHSFPLASRPQSDICEMGAQ